MASKKSYPAPKFNIDDNVIVDLSGSGKPYHFGKVVSSTPEKVGCNDSHKYEIDGLDFQPTEYYIRKADDVDLKFKAMYDEMNIGEFEIDDDKIKRDFWRTQEKPLEKAMGFINNFLHPYLKEKNHVLTTDKMCDWDSRYSKALHLKNEYVFILPSDKYNIVVQSSGTHITLFITAPDPFDYKHDKNCEKAVLAIYVMAVEYSDDEFVDKLREVVEEIIIKLNHPDLRNYTNLKLDRDVIEKVEMFKTVLDYHHEFNTNYKELPGYEYTRALFDLSVMRYSIFSSNFNFK